MSRRKRKAIFTLFVCAIFLFILIDQRYGGRFSHIYSDQRGTISTSYDAQRYHDKTFRVVKVVDGDTIDIDSADGEKDYTRIRLWGVDTPETKRPGYGVMYFGPQASEFTKKLVSGEQVRVYLEPERDSRDKYGRLLAYVMSADGRFLNEALLEEGFAYADLRFRHSLYNKYIELEAAARRNKKGLWEGVTREQLPEWLRREKPNFLLK